MEKMVDFVKRHVWWLVPLLLFDVMFFSWLLSGRGQREEQPSIQLAPSAALPLPEEPARPPGLRFGYPTDQRDLLNTTSVEVYQPTASGRVESALYGSVRTASFGGRLLPSFHEGIDIASRDRDRRGRPLDPVYAVADGQVVYVNRVAGNSNYGIYAVLTHEDPVGDIYSLYSHLASVERSLQAGQSIQRGDVIGVMGNTASTGIPMVRAHLHFEIGMIKNMGFATWYRAQKKIPDHGTWHGHNLTGIDPLAVYADGSDEPVFSMLDYLKNVSPAFVLLFEAPQALDYFHRYPGLWVGERHQGNAQVIAVSEGGVPISGRTATEEEEALLGRAFSHVLMADETVLGRNGLRLVVQRQGTWELGRAGERWLEILMY
jgi:murein DD-endopeptidase MepM/ murein hydrolase activator NlpD